MNARIEPSLLGKMSERRVLRVLQSGGPLSRAEVARLTGLSAPAVSRAAASLLRSRLLEESDEARQTGGLTQPGHTAGLQGLGIEGGKDPFQRVVRGDAAGQA